MNGLDVDCLYHVFKHLQAGAVACSCSLVCKEWSEAADQDLVWRDFYARDIGDPPETITEMSWKAQYKEDYCNIRWDVDFNSTYNDLWTQSNSDKTVAKTGREGWMSIKRAVEPLRKGRHVWGVRIDSMCDPSIPSTSDMDIGFVHFDYRWSADWLHSAPNDFYISQQLMETGDVVICEVDFVQNRTRIGIRGKKLLRETRGALHMPIWPACAIRSTKGVLTIVSASAGELDLLPPAEGFKVTESSPETWSDVGTGDQYSSTQVGPPKPRKAPVPKVAKPVKAKKTPAAASKPAPPRPAAKKSAPSDSDDDGALGSMFG